MTNTPPPTGFPGTELETDEEIRQVLAAKFGPQVPAPKPSTDPFELPPAVKLAIKPFRPTLRPPTAELTVLDDGKPEGEIIRIRADHFTVGRTEGDLLLPHDRLIAERHIAIERVQTTEGFHFAIVDQPGSSGLFVRVRVALLGERAEFLAGMGRFRFDGIGSLAEILPSGKEIRHPVLQAEVWIGADATCEIHRPHDPFMEPRHARLFHDKKGWHVQHYKSLNGLWLRVNRIDVESHCVFQIGEQRCRLQLEVDLALPHPHSRWPHAGKDRPRYRYPHGPGQ